MNQINSLQLYTRQDGVLTCRNTVLKTIKSKHFTYEYSNREIGANKNEGQVRLDKSPVNEARVFKNEEKLPC